MKNWWFLAVIRAIRLYVILGSHTNTERSIFTSQWIIHRMKLSMTLKIDEILCSDKQNLVAGRFFLIKQVFNI